MIRMKDFTEDEKIELNDYFDSEIKKAHLNGDWWGDKILEIAERHYKKLIKKVRKRYEEVEGYPPYGMAARLACDLISKEIEKDLKK